MFQKIVLDCVLFTRVITELSRDFDDSSIQAFKLISVSPPNSADVTYRHLTKKSMPKCLEDRRSPRRSWRELQQSIYVSLRFVGSY